MEGGDVLETKIEREEMLKMKIKSNDEMWVILSVKEEDERAK